MPCSTRMRTICLRGLLWLYLLGLGCVVVSVEPGYLDFDNLPDTNFSCVGKVIGGYYADLETNCQMFHVCTIGQLDEPMDIRFLCLNGTVFDQETRVCERIDEVDCSKSEQFYSLNLELYGNTQPSVSEDNADTDPPIIIKASTTSTTTTTTTRRPKTKTTKTFFTTGVPTATTVTKVISAHHFPVSGSPDIRFNPEEINISLNPGSGSLASIRPKSVAYQQQVFNDNDNKKIVVTTHTSYGSTEKEDFVRVVPNTQRPQSSSTLKVKSQSPATPADINYGFTYHQTEDNSQEYTEAPHNFQYHHSSVPFRYRTPFKTTTYRTELLATTRKHPTTFRTPYSSLKPTYHTYRTENPQRLQLPLPLLPTLPPLTFSSPAPFSLSRHIETKRYTNDHQAPPRIIISASASVSDNSGRRLNYSLGTIGVSPLLEEPPRSYDDYKDHDVVLDPFYHDVPKIKSKRKKRQADVNGDQAAADVLKFLFDWYKNHQKTSSVKAPISSEDITEINEQLAPIVEAPIRSKDEESEYTSNFKESALFKRKSKFNIIGDILSITEVPVSSQKPTPVTVPTLEAVDYVDDNYEAVAQQTKTKDDKVTTEKEIEVTTVETTTLPPTTTTTEPTTTSRIMGILRKRAKVHQARILKENQKRYTSSLHALKPKIRTRERQKFTTRTHKVEEIITTTSKPVEVITERVETTTIGVAATTTRINREVELTTGFPANEEKHISTTIIPEEYFEETTKTLLKDDKRYENKTEAQFDENVIKEKKETQVIQSSEEATTPQIEISYEGEETEYPHDQLQVESKINHDMNTPIEETTVSGYLEEEDVPQNETSTLKEESQVVEASREPSELEKDKIEESRTDREYEEYYDDPIDETTVFDESQHKIENETTTQKEESQIVDDIGVGKTEIKTKERGRYSYNERTLEKFSTNIEHRSWIEEESSTVSDIENQEVDDDDVDNVEDLVQETTATPEEIIDGEFEATTPKEESQNADDDEKKELKLNSPERNSDDEERSTKQVSSEGEESVDSKMSDNGNQNSDAMDSEAEEATIISEGFRNKVQNEATEKEESQNVNDEEKVKLRSRGRGRGRYRSSYKTKEEEKKDIFLKSKDTERTEFSKKNQNKETSKEETTTQKEESQILVNEPEKIKEKLRIRGRSRSRNRDNEEPVKLVSSTEETVIESSEPKNETEEVLEASILQSPVLNEETEIKDEVVLSKPKASQDDNIETEASVINSETTTEAAYQVSEYTEDVPEDTEESKSKTEETTLFSSTEIEHTTFYTTQENIEETTLEVHAESSTSSTTSTTEDYEVNSNVYQTVATESSSTIDSRSTTDSESATNLTPVDITTTETPIPPRRRSRPRTFSSYRKPNPRHRFSTELTSPSSRRKPAIEKEIIDSITSQLTTTESLTREEIPSTSRKIIDYSEDVPATDAPLFKSANPTQAESAKESLHTTPLSMAYKLHVRKEKLKSYIFNCFGKAINKFYSDPRDCRLFHYCTSGYTKNQLLDMKFVCDLGTYFDDEKLICTKIKPERCL